jgi:pimeloyl-ACP methyl ester carboxylesterase
MHSVSSTKFITLSNGVKLFYREAGSAANPTILLLHGFPTSSIMYRHLITALAPKYHVLAPDFPGWGFSESSPATKPSFAYFADTIELFLEALHVNKFALYVFDIGAPTGFRLALKRPKDVLAIISQNGNVYSDGLSRFWDLLRPLWNDPTNETIRAGLAEKLFTIDGFRGQYEAGTKDPATLDPATWTLDYAVVELLGKSGQEDRLNLLSDYHTNLTLYPDIHAFLRESNVPILAIWGKNDPLLLPAGAEAFKKDSKNAHVKVLDDAGHFALESNLQEIVDEIFKFFQANGI